MQADAEARLVLEQLRRRGCRIEQREGRLIVSPASALSADDREAVARCKGDLLAVLDAERPGLSDEDREGIGRMFDRCRAQIVRHPKHDAAEEAGTLEGGNQ